MKRIAIFLVLALANAHAMESSGYVRDVEKLLNSLDSHDPARPDLTLKLADALFNEARDLSGKPNLSSGEQNKIVADRKKSITLYRDAINGLHGVYPVPKGVKLAKIQFQLARLYSDIGDGASADALFRELSHFDALPDIQRESLLRLAEKSESKGGQSDLATAAEDFKKALSLCSGQDNCAYCHYRLAWIYSRQGHVPEAVSEIEPSLWDAKGQVREESLRDYIAFMASAGDNGHASLEKIEKLAGRTGHEASIEDLAEAYFAQGNRVAGVYVLEAYQRRHPSARNAVRLLEEQYGFRDWAQFDSTLDEAMDLSRKPNSDINADSEKILRRLTVQLDGERASHPERAAEFKKTVLFYLDLFPTSSERSHMIDGWLAAETDNSVKLEQLARWIQEESQSQHVAEVARLRKARASVAQQAHAYDIVASEAGALGGIATNAKDKREFDYQTAYALYQQKDFSKALPAFQKLASPPQSDKWGIQSEHLALDILAQSKDYDRLIQQAQVWTRDPRYEGWLISVKDTDLIEMRKIENSARFERAIALGSTPEALGVFLEDCEKHEFVPKSCANAQVVAEKLGDESALIKILQLQDKKDELANEYEASGEFVKSAELREKSLPKKASVRDYLKLAMLYELGARTADRDRILRELANSLSGQKSLGAEEDLLFKTFSDANLLEGSVSKLAWSADHRAEMDELRAERGSANAEVRAHLVASCKDLGPEWVKASLAELRGLDEKQKKIHFGGNGSKRKFEERVAALKRLEDKGNCYLQNTSAVHRVIVSSLLSNSAAGLAAEVKSTAIPDGVDEAGKAALEKALADMAQPFNEQSEKFKSLAQAQLEKVSDPATRENLQSQIAKNDNSVLQEPTPASVATSVSAAAHEPSALEKAALQELHRNPNQKASLEQLKSYYDSIGNVRLSAYFQGRLEQLNGTGNEEIKK